MRRATTALLSAAVLGLAGCAGSSEDAAAPSSAPPSSAAPSKGPASPSPTAGGGVEPDDAQVVSVTFAGGEVNGDTGRVELPVGTDVRLTITSDVAEEVHVHGYNLTQALPPGQATQLEFVVDQPGIFEVELHDAGMALTRLQVS